MSRAQEIVYLPGLPALVESATASGITQNAVADAIGIDRSFLSNLIKQNRGASLAVARNIARYFETSIESLLEKPSPKKVSKIVSI